jgi:hypothetical protein
MSMGQENQPKLVKFQNYLVGDWLASWRQESSSHHSNKPRAGRTRNRSLTLGKARSFPHLNIVQTCWDQSTVLCKEYWGLFIQGNKAHHSSLYSVEVTNGIAIPPLLPHMSSWHSAQLMNPSATLAFKLCTQLSIFEGTLCLAEVFCGFLHSLLANPVTGPQIRAAPPP